MTPEEKDAYDKLNSKEWRLSNLYKIQTKNKELITLPLNNAQKDYISKRGNRNMILKARQMGFSTIGLIDLLDDTIVNENTSSAIVAHERQKVTVLFEIIQRAFENMPEELKPVVSLNNRNELYFPELDSKIFVTLNARSLTAHNIHISELGFMRDAESMIAATMPSLPPDGKVTFESTANGMSGYFFDEWDDKDSPYQKFFYNWLWDDTYKLKTNKTMEELEQEYRPLQIQYELIEDINRKHDLSEERFAWYIRTVREQKHKTRQEYPTTQLEAFIASGRNVFSIVDLNKHITRPPDTRMWQDLLVWETPLYGFRYVIGCDTAEGVGGDFSVISVWNAHTGEQVAEYASNRIAPDTLGGYLQEIGKYYNNALIVLEINNHGLATLNVIKHRYSNIYKREVKDKRSMQLQSTLGFRTTATTKPILVDQLEEAVRTQSIKINSKELIDEMKVFVQTDDSNKQGFGAEGSKHDDRVIAAGLAVQGFSHMPRFKVPKTVTQLKFERFVKEQNLPVAQRQKVKAQGRNYKIRGINSSNK